LTESGKSLTATTKPHFSHKV